MRCWCITTKIFLTLSSKGKKAYWEFVMVAFDFVCLLHLSSRPVLSACLLWRFFGGFFHEPLYTRSQSSSAISHHSFALDLGTFLIAPYQHSCCLRRHILLLVVVMQKGKWFDCKTLAELFSKTTFWKPCFLSGLVTFYCLIAGVPHDIRIEEDGVVIENWERLRFSWKKNRNQIYKTNVSSRFMVGWDNILHRTQDKQMPGLIAQENIQCWWMHLTFSDKLWWSFAIV